VSRPLRDVVIAAVALGVIALALFLAGCGGTGSTQSSTAQLQAQPQAQAITAARHFLNLYVDPDGRVVRRDQGGDTVGEGQAYGMLLAAAIGDSQRFNAIWDWTQNNLRRPDGLLEFRWSDGRVQSTQAASDADLDASRALLLAACRFHRPALRLQAVQLGNSILRVEVASFQGVPVLTAGPWAVTPPITIDPSYFSPATFVALQAASGDARWGALAASSRSITSELMSPPWKLPPEFSFDAVRTLVRMAEDPNPAGPRIAARAWPVFEGANPANLPVQHELSGRPIGDVRNPVVLVAAAGAADAAGHPAARDGLLDEAQALDLRFPTYYGAAWVALGRMMLTTKLLDPTCS